MIPRKMHSEQNATFLAFLLLILSSDASKGFCPPGWLESTHSGTCIKLYHSQKSWYNARTACTAVGGDLVKIVNSKMNQFVVGKVSQDRGETYWFGLNDRKREGTFRWLDEYENITYTAWNWDQPNDFRGQDCGEINYPTMPRGKWSDGDCWDTNKFICEKSPAFCPSGWQFSKHSATCIKLYNDKASWFRARDTCKNVGADLVKIMNSAMNQFIVDQVSSDRGHPYWFGLNDRKWENTFHWLDEYSEVPYKPWGQGQPNDSGGQDCGEINYPTMSKGTWSDGDCWTNYKFICEKLPECPKGKYGVSCENTCSSKCAGSDNECNYMDGSCDRGCEAGYLPPPCFCPPGWLESTQSGTCIKLYHSQKSWYNARTTCTAVGGDLVKIVNSKMNQFIAHRLSADRGKTYWFGLNDRTKEGTFMWLDQSEKATYTAWNWGQPNDYRGQDCGEINYPAIPVGEWSDGNCWSFNKFICEKSPAFCPSGWQFSKHSATCIKLYNDKASWFRARSACSNVGADLVKIINPAMNQFILDQVASDRGQTYWFGLNDLKKEGQFFWLDEEDESLTNHQVPYKPWGKDQPNNYLEQHCGEFNYPTMFPGTWSDGQCSAKYKFICEKPAGCPKGKYGRSCENTCNSKCAGSGNGCNYMDGSCDSE